MCVRHTHLPFSRHTPTTTLPPPHTHLSVSLSTRPTLLARLNRRVPAPSPVAPTCTPVPSRTAARILRSTGARSFSPAQASGRRAQESLGEVRGSGPSRPSAGGRNRELSLFFNEGEESAGDSDVVATKEATAPRLCPPPALLGKTWGSWLQTSGRLVKEV